MKNTNYKMNYKLYTQLKFWIIWVKMQTCSYRWKEKNPSNWHRIPWNTDGWVEQNRWQCLFVWGFLWKSIEHSSEHKFLEHRICWQHCHCHYHSTTLPSIELRAFSITTHPGHWEWAEIKLQAHHSQAQHA